MVSGRLERVGFRAVVEGIGTYVRDARRMQQAQAQVGTSADTAAKKSANFDKRLRAVGSQMQETGRQAVFLGTALTGLAAGPAFLAARFESAFVKIETLVGESREALQGMKGDVLAISAETARGPQELAEALFVIESGGLRGAEAIETLRAAASAAAIGLGRTDQIARITTQALIAFREQNLTAAEAVDILVGTARAGNFETSQLAGVFGRVLPLAAELGIKFSDLGGFVAAYTRVGGDAANATTALSAVLITLTRGGKTAQDTLEEVGLSLGGLKQIATEQGLAQALIEILRAVEEGGGAAEEKLALIIPNIRALRGVLATAGVQSEAFLEIQEEVANSLGLTAEGLARLNEDPLFQFQKAVNNLKIALIELGVSAAPALAIVTAALELIGDALTSLPGQLQQSLLLITAVGGALLIGGGTIGIFAGGILQLVAALRTARVALVGFQITALATNAVLASSVIGLVAIVAAFLIFRRAADDAATATLELAVKSAALETAQDRTAESIRASNKAIKEQIELLQQQRDALGLVTRNSINQTKEYSDQVDQAEELDEAIDTLNFDYEANAEALTILAQREAEAALQAAETEDQLKAAAEAVKALTKDLSQLSAQEFATTFATRLLRDAITGGFSFDDPTFLSSFVAELRELQRQEAQIASLAGLLLDLSDPGFFVKDDDPTGGAAKELDKFADQVEAALADARRAAEGELDLLGNVIRTALRRSAAAERDAALEAIADERTARREAHDERIRQLDEEERRTLAAIDARLEATLGPLRAELEALDEAAQAEERGDIVRRLALAFDARDRARIEQELRDFDRRARADDIRDQIDAAEETAAGETDAASEGFDQRRDLLDQELDAVLENLDAQRDATRDAYSDATDAFTIESEARRLILEGELDEMTALLESQVPEWRSAGLSFAEALLDGLRAGGAAEFVGGLAGAVGRGTAAGTGGAVGLSPETQQQIAQLQLLGINLKEEGSPEFVLDSFRDEIRALGGVPAFHQGGIVGGGGGREMLVRALPGEGIFTREQMAALNRPVFEPGAFRGMFDGAHFDGDAQENAAAIEARFDRMMDRALTRGAATAGARSRIA